MEEFNNYSQNEPPVYISQEPAPKKRKTAVLLGISIVCIILAIITIFGGIVRITNIHIHNTTDTAYGAIEIGEDYYINELLVIDVFANITNEDDAKTSSDAERATEEDFNKSTAVYYIGCFFDGNEKCIYVPLRINKEDDLYEKGKNYILDDNTEVGSFVVTGCFSVSSDLSKDFDIYGYYKDLYEYYSDALPGEITNLVFDYDNIESIAEYEEKEQTGGIVFIGFGAVFLVAGVVLLILFIKKNKKLKSEIEVPTGTCISDNETESSENINSTELL